jgi:hypothetical protein
LANTVANIYYKILLLKKINYGPGYWPKYGEKNDFEPFENLVNFVNVYNKLKIDVKSIPEFIHGLREIDRHKGTQKRIY